MNRCGAQDVGGITPLVKVVHMYETFGVPFDMHMADPGNLQVLGTTLLSEYYERGLLHPYLDYDVPPPYLNRIFDPMDEEGYVHISEAPGIGLDINFRYKMCIRDSLLSMDTDLRPAISSSSLLKAIVASIVGGVGNIRGALVAGMLIGFIENFAILWVGSGWKDAIPLVLIVIFMLLRPSVFGIEETA